MSTERLVVGARSGPNKCAADHKGGVRPSQYELDYRKSAQPNGPHKQDAWRSHLNYVGAQHRLGLSVADYVDGMKLHMLNKTHCFE